MLMMMPHERVTKWARRSAFAAAVVSGSVSCIVAMSVPDQAVRCPVGDPRCATSTEKLVAFERHDTYTINYVEVKDDGIL